MKKLLLPLVLLISIQIASAQAYPRFIDNQEIKFNIGLFLATTTVEGSYEYFCFHNILWFRFFRAYFGYQPRSGFFAEAFGLYYTGENDPDNDNLGARNNDYNTVALGLGIGNKWVTRSQKFSMEIHGGFGRNINPEDFQDTFIYRVGLSIGFRF